MASVSAVDGYANVTKPVPLGPTMGTAAGLPHPLLDAPNESMEPSVARAAKPYEVVWTSV